MNRIVLIIAAAFVFITTSCSFDSMFLHPHKINPAELNKMVILTPERIELQVEFTGENYQPSFLKNGLPFKLDCQIESILFDSNNGNTLHAWYIKQNDNTAPVANILFLHGNAGNILLHFGIVYPLVKKGFNVFLFDYSGFGLSGGKAGRKSVLADAESALNHFVSTTQSKEIPLLVYGQSLGGNLAAVVAARHQDKVDALVIEGAFSSHKDVAAHVSGLGILARVFVKEMYASKKAIRKWKKPVLVIHSTEDAVVPFFMGKKIFENANEPKVFLEIDKAHILGPVYYTDDIVEKIKGLLIKKSVVDKK